ncbi:hypothetical protein ES703_123924 [subsurface metagenome]
MEEADLILILSRLAVGAFGTFFAILLWSQTRDIAWVLVVIGTLISYAEIVFTTLERFGIIAQEIYDLSGIPIFKLLLVNLPMLLYSLAFITVISRKRLP